VTNLAEQTSVVDFLPQLEYCYRNSVPLGGVLEEDIPPEQRDMYEDMAEKGLLSVTTRLTGDRIFCITMKGAILLPLPILQDCLTNVAVGWMEVMNRTNIRPIYYGPFHTRVE
jgi:hypothetical protein